MNKLNVQTNALLDEIILADAYRHSFWGIGVADAQTGEELYEINGDRLFIPASTTKLWSCAAALDAFGADFRFVTPLHHTGEVTPDGTLEGELVLRAVGDPNLSGRTDENGRLLFTNHDHTYADFFEAELTGVDPIEGLDDFARQVAASGIRRVRDVVVDDRLFDREAGELGGPLRSSPVMVNDNVVDILLTPAESVGALASMELHPKTAYAQFDCQVETVEPGSGGEIQVVPLSTRSFAVQGKIEKGHKPVVKVAWMLEPQDFARTLLVERLAAHGVRVERSALLPNDPGALPALDAYGRLPMVARRTSPPFHETTRVVLKVSHNMIADVLPQLVASRVGKRKVQDGLALQGEFLRGLGIEPGSAVFGSGSGGSITDHTSPRAALRLLRAMAVHRHGGVYRQGLPILGVDGTLSDAVGPESPVRGKVQAKTGTAIMQTFSEGSILTLSKALAGYMTASSGRELVLALFVNQVPAPTLAEVMRQGQVLGKICEVLYQSL